MISNDSNGWLGWWKTTEDSEQRSHGQLDWINPYEAAPWGIWINPWLEILLGISIAMMGQDFHYGMHQPLDQKTSRTQLAKFLRLLHSNQVGSYLRYLEILLLVSRQESESLATSCSKHVPNDLQRNAWMVQVTAAVWLTRKNKIKWWTEDEQRINRGWIATLSHHIIFQKTSHRTIPNQHRAWCRYCRCPRGSQEIPGAAACLRNR